ncbi:MAG TPA: type II toxin-antitoxin system antitoxin SocA domain-containing protein [Thermoanaerobaculia bacterium]|nr:type II toxin-antitoxin system antitoxin SocA domain-containing protein [Thermoanaerobaculia bacterium]
MRTMDSRYRLKQMILFIASEMQGADYFGATKLNKVLFRSEMAAFQELGGKLTTFHYQKNENGPTLRAFMPVTREMEVEGLLAWEIRTQGVSEERRPIAKAPYDESALAPEEWEVLRKEIRRAFPLTARQMSDEEHKTAAWYATRTGEDIKPELSFVEDPGVVIPLSPDEDEIARHAVERFLARA